MRIDPPNSGPELAQLTAFLDFQRETVLGKTEGLTAEQMAQALPPSSMTLGGLLNHLALVEDSWFRVRFAGLPDDELWAGIDWDADPDYEFRTAADVSPDQLSAVARRNGEHFDLRWMLLHMIEETARHAGHADLLREAIDGAVGE